MILFLLLWITCEFPCILSHKQFSFLFPIFYLLTVPFALTYSAPHLGWLILACPLCKEVVLCFFLACKHDYLCDFLFFFFFFFFFSQFPSFFTLEETFGSELKPPNRFNSRAAWSFHYLGVVFSDALFHFYVLRSLKAPESNEH